MKRKIVSGLILFLVATFSTVAQMNWPDGKKAAIVLTYDDGLDSHLDVAIPQLDRFGFKGTFYLYSYLSENRFADWKKVSDNGHELGNHSLFHPCTGKGSSGKPSRYSSESYDVPSMLREIGVMTKLLFAITGKQPTSYAYPCGETVVGGVDYVDSLRASGLVRFARGVGKSPVVTDFKDINYLNVPCFGAPSGSDAGVLTDFAEQVLKKHGLGVFIFHGVGGDYLNMGASEHLALLKFLSGHIDEIWVAPFSEVMEYIQKNAI
jgi:peptidoglycan/xylan/chitin deacetylase (PgdA/CDA1 family)